MLTAVGCMYSLILEQNILVAVMVVFSILASHLPHRPTPVSTHSPIHIQKHILNTTPPPISMLLPRESFQQIPPGKGGWCLEGLFELQDVVKAELHELACTCSDTSLAHSPDTLQTRFH